MPNLLSLLQKIPAEFKPFAALGIGALILVCLVLFHGVCLHRILIQYKRADMRLRMGRPHLGHAAFLFGWSVFLMLAIHIVEIIAWALSLVYLGLIVRTSDAIYFCANAYTTLGYGTVDLGASWRNISPIIAISGLFTLAWTTSMLVNIVGMYVQLFEQLETERLKELQIRAAARNAEWNAVAKERTDESEAKVETRGRAAGLSFFARRKLRREEKQNVETMRTAMKDELENLHRQERLDEDKLGEGPTPGNSGDPATRK